MGVNIGLNQRSNTDVTQVTKPVQRAALGYRVWKLEYSCQCLKDRVKNLRVNCTLNPVDCVGRMGIYVVPEHEEDARRRFVRPDLMSLCVEMIERLSAIHPSPQRDTSNKQIFLDCKSPWRKQLCDSLDELLAGKPCLDCRQIDLYCGDVY